MEKVTELIDDLAGLEFKGKSLENDLRRNVELGLPHFSIRYKKKYGEEQMLFDLEFWKDHELDAYRLEQYTATLRKPVEITHEVINGVDTKELGGKNERG